VRSVSNFTPRSRFIAFEPLLERIALVALGLEAHDDVAVHGDEAAVAVVGEARVVGLRDEALGTVSSLRPRFRTVSIMPGIEARAPERTESSSGSEESPNVLPCPSRRR
jgi:hypothetical protein